MKGYRYKEYISNVLPCFMYGIICGSIVGASIFFFKIAAHKAEQLSRYVYKTAGKSAILVGLVFLALIALALLMSYIHKESPEAKGGGIPRTEGVLRGILTFKWLRTLIGTFFCSMMSFFAGLPLGSEGPSVLMGTALGGMCGEASKNKSAWSRYIMSGGAGAGFAVATGAPLSGILFALEEIHKRFTPMLVLTVSISVVSATCVNEALCSLFGIDSRLFTVESLANFKLGQIGYLLLLGVIISVAVGVFDMSIVLLGDLTERVKRFLRPEIKLAVVFIITGVLGFTFAGAIYSGHHTIIEVLDLGFNVGVIALLLFVRLILMLLVTDSGATGGIFIPTLAIGALVSALIAKLLIVIGMPTELYATVVLLGMAAFIGGTLRSPLTASVLFIELTGQFSNLLYVALVIFTVNFATEIFNFRSFYDSVIERMEHAQNQGRKPSVARFEMVVSSGAFVVGKAVRDIMWPSSSVVTGVTRAHESGSDTDSDGEKKLYAGDKVVMRARFFDEEQFKQYLCGLIGNDSSIKRME